MGNKYLLSLGYDYRMENGQPVAGDQSMVFKIWDFVGLDDYVPKSDNTLTGGFI